MDAYATEAQLTVWLPAGTTVDDAERLLVRASELLDSMVIGGYSIADDTGLPTDTDVATALRDACCAQVEFWLEVGEEHDVVGLAGSVAVGQLRVDRLPNTLAPRARRILGNAGLFREGVIDSGWVW